ncbi:ATP-binding protein [Rhizobium leguminosarum]|uniref:ATP-binding protein n=1 Tax=Rhizobium leguminosarum TaxID=384 RepID=UPI00103196B6|nr:ATP-binding protein [Rhizobium leguminosarum]TAZ31333.1 ATP-binding protein [Rhizobium leguminosarum]
MSIRVNIANQVRQTTVLQWRPLLPLFEAVMNSFQAIKEANLSSGISGRITIEVVRSASELALDVQSIEGFRIIDNGVGLDDDNYDSFNTAFSPHKLNRGGKGLGRFTWLKAFAFARVTSTFKDEEGVLHTRSFVFDESYDVDDMRSLPKPAEQAAAGTTVELIDLKSDYRGQCPRTVEVLIQKLIEHFILVLLDKNCPEVWVVDLGLKHKLNDVFERDYKATASTHSFEIESFPFTLYGFRLPTSRATKHKLVYAADQRSVLSDRLADHLPNLAARIEGSDGKPFFYLGIIQGPYLTEHVNTNRTDFEFGNPDDAELELPLSEHMLIAKSEIRTAALAFVQEDLKDVLDVINAAKLEKIRRYVREEAPQYRILLRQADKFLGKLSPNPTRADMEAVLHRELFIRETELKRDSSRIIREAGKVTDYDTYHKQFTEFLERYNELGASALAQYVQHRRIIIDFLERTIRLPDDERKFPLEKVVHQLVYPMQQTSEEIPPSEQNLWLIDERLTFHSFISSDKRNNAMSVLESNDKQRGDIVIFDEKIIFSDERPNDEHPLSSIIVIEFKQPGRTKYSADENPVLQAAKVINAIRDGKYRHKGRAIPIANAEIPAQIFVIADLTPRLRQILKDFSATQTPDNQGYYGYHPNYRVYYEVMDYAKMLGDAKKRNRIFFDKLNLVDNR